MGKFPYFRVFPTFWWYNLSNDLIHIFSKQILQWNTKFSLGILWPNPISTLYLEIKTLAIYSGHIRGNHNIAISQNAVIKTFQFS
jgi:hypothetical protein